MSNMARDADIVEGDIVVTSGLAAIIQWFGNR